VSAASLQAREATEAPGADRADVALLVATRGNGALAHARFDELHRFLVAGDLLVVNTSATLAAALPARLGDRPVGLHLSTPLDDERWVVELRTPERQPFGRVPAGTRVELPDGAHADLLAPYAGSGRLRVARLVVGVPLAAYLARHGRPIRYAHATRERSLADHQTVFALHPGSAEMPSAGRPFTAELVTGLVARGVLIAPITLHTGVSSLEHGERPYPERFAVPAVTASLVNAVHGWGGRVVAVGTTVVRALETVAAGDGTVRSGEGTTSLVITPERGLRAIDGLLSGFHEHASSHLRLLEAAAGDVLLRRSYAAARTHGYRWHEFGDAHLVLP
jgi:S-adenosylmethionine:tRNA ribosyltransferase-isomerase